MYHTAPAKTLLKQAVESDETRPVREKYLFDAKMQSSGLRVQYKLEYFRIHVLLGLIFESGSADLNKSHMPELAGNAVSVKSSRPARHSDKSQTPELSDDAKTCIQILESAMGRPTNPDITARDLDSMLADYVDEEEDSVELVRSVRDDIE